MPKIRLLLWISEVFTALFPYSKFIPFLNYGCNHFYIKLVKTFEKYIGKIYIYWAAAILLSRISLYYSLPLCLSISMANLIVARLCSKIRSKWRNILLNRSDTLRRETNKSIHKLRLSKKYVKPELDQYILHFELVKSTY